MTFRYARIIVRICGDAKTPNQRIAIRILQWMLVAQRPLKRYEIESGIILDGRVLQITPASKGRRDVLNLCNPILEVDDDPGGNVSFSHSTALESVFTLVGRHYHRRNLLMSEPRYLKSPQNTSVLQTPQAHLTVSLSCSLCLASGLDLIDPRIPDDESLMAVALSLHDVLLYAQDYFHAHLSATLDLQGESPHPTTDLGQLRSSITSLTSKYHKLFPSQSQEIEDLTGRFSRGDCLWGGLDLSTSARKMLDKALVSRSEASELIDSSRIRARKYASLSSNAYLSRLI